MKTNIRKTIWLLAAGSLMLQSFPVSRAEDSNADKIEELERRAETYRKLIELKQQQQGTLNNQLALIEAEDRKLEAELELKKDQLGDVESQVGRLKGQIGEYEKSLFSQRIVLKDLIRVYYDSRKSDAGLGWVGSNDFYGNLRHEDGLIQAGGRLDEAVANLSMLKTGLEKEKTSLEQKQAEIAELTDQLEEKNEKLESNRAEKKTLLAVTRGEEAKYQKLLDNIENEIYNIESKKTVDYSNLPPAKGGYFDYPVSEPSVTQSYGCLKDSFARRSYPACDGGKGGFHNGIDFGKNSGGNIFAVKSGKVIESGNNRGYAYGQYLVIDHGDGLVTLYGHLSSKAVSKGDRVNTGEKIGTMGTTGYSTGVHLHFTVFDKKSFELVQSSYVSGLYIPAGASINPSRYLK